MTDIQDLEARRRANGEFGNKLQSEPAEGVVTRVENPDAAYNELFPAVDSAEGKLVDVAGQALSAIIKDRFPDATAITVIDGAEPGEERNLILASIKQGDDTILDTTLGRSTDEEFLDAIGDWTPTLGRDINKLDRVKKHKIWGLSLTGEAGDDALQNATAAVAELTDLADNGNKRLAALARQSVEERVKKKFPTAASVTLVNENGDGDGWPYLSLQSVQDADGNTIFDAEDEDDYEFTEYVNEMTVATDRDLDALEDIDEGMDYEGTWRLTF